MPQFKSTLTELRNSYEAAEREFNEILKNEFPGLTKFHWFRACDHVKGNGIGRKNEDTSQDAELANHLGLRTSWQAYNKSLHEFYRSRDGEHGFLG